MTAFQVNGNPRVQSIPSVFQATTPNGSPSLTTQAGFRQFEWLAKVTLTGSLTGSFQVGMIQNVLEFSSKATYTSSWNDSQPRTVTATLPKFPILDSKQMASAWTSNKFSLLGTIPAPPGPLPPGISGTTSAEAFLSDGDDPGENWALVSSKDSTKLLSQIEERYRFVTWVAVRPVGAPAQLVGSFEFLQHAVWSITRRVAVHRDANGILMLAPLLTNSNTLQSVSPGKGPFVPVITPPIANQAVTLVHFPP